MGVQGKDRGKYKKNIENKIVIAVIEYNKFIIW